MKLDERGKQCPKPVIDTKKALESCNPGETVEVLVDNEIAVQNLSKMAASKGLSAVSEKISDNEFSVKIPNPCYNQARKKRKSRSEPESKVRVKLFQKFL